MFLKIFLLTYILTTDSFGTFDKHQFIDIRHTDKNSVQIYINVQEFLLGKCKVVYPQKSFNASIILLLYVKQHLHELLS